MQRRRSWITAAVVVLAATAAPAAGLAGQPVMHDHGTFTDGPYATDFCGVPGTEIDTVRFSLKLDPGVAFQETSTFKGVFTADATGTSLELSAANLEKGVAVDNGDGTLTVTEHNAGLVLRFKTENGGVLKDADGKPIIGAGVIDSVTTIDLATGDVISVQQTFHGPHPLHDGVDICGPAVAYLTS